MKMKDLALYSSVIGAFLIFMGVFKLEIFYSHFGITITDYLSFSEIITSFLDDITLIIILFSLMLLHIIIGSGIVKALMNMGRSRKATFDTIARLTNHNSRKGYKFLVFTVISIGVSLWAFYEYNQKWLIYLIALFFFQGLVFCIDKLVKKNKDISEAKLFSFSLFLLVFFLLWAIAQFEINCVEKGLTGKTTVVTEAFTLASDKNKLYLGKTDKYLFFYEMSSKKVEIITTDKLKAIIKENMKPSLSNSGTKL